MTTQVANLGLSKMEMAMGILFTSFPCIYFDKAIYFRYTHFGETYDYLRRHLSDNILLLDAAFGGTLKNLCAVICLNNIDIVVIYCEAISDFPYTVECMRFLSKFFPHLNFFLYGDIGLYLPEYLEAFDIDAFHITGDPDIAIERYIHYKRGRIDEDDLCNIIYRCKGAYKHSLSQDVVNKPRCWGFPPLDALPLPQYFAHIVSQGEFNKTNNKPRTIAVTAAKGCERNCFYCPTSAREGIIDRRRPLSQLLDWLTKHAPNYDMIQFVAPDFCFNPDWCHKFCRQYMKSGLKVPWKCCTTLRCLKNIDLSLFKQADCRVISFGVETLKSDSPFKKVQWEELRSVANALKMYDIIGRAYIMLGLSGHSKVDVDHTICSLLDLGLCVRPACYTPVEKLRELKCSELDLAELKQFDRESYLAPWNQLRRDYIMRLLCQEFGE